MSLASSKDRVSPPFSWVRKSSFGVLSQVGNVQALLALIPTYSKQPKLSALALILISRVRSRSFLSPLFPIMIIVKKYRAWVENLCAIMTSS